MTNVDLTVVVFIIGFCVDTEDAEAAVVFLSSLFETTEYVVVKTSSSTTVVDSTLLIELVGRGRGRGAFVVSTYESVAKICSSLNFVGAVVVVVVTGFREVEFLRDVIVVLRFTAMVDEVVTTGFRVVVCIRVDVAFFDGFDDAVGRLVGLIVVDAAGTADSVDETDVLFTVVATGLLAETVLGFVGFVLDVTFIVLFVSFLIEFWIDWNVVNLMFSVVLAGSSFNLIVLEILRSTMFPSVVENPPTFIEYFSVVVDFLVAIGLFAAAIVVAMDDDDDIVVGISSKVLLL